MSAARNDQVEPRSELAFAFFARLFARTLRQTFHAVRLADRPAAAVAGAPHLIVYSNHPSWWDGMLFVFLARELFPGRPVFTPVDAAMIRRYGFFARIGGFPVERDTFAGARQFRTVTSAVLRDPRNVLLLNAQGRFCDARERPLALAPGLAHLARDLPHALFVPLAIEYAHRDERRPELWLRFGEPVSAASLPHTIPDRLSALETRLTDVMDRLAADVIAGDMSAFETISAGRRGIHPIYDGWRHLRARLRGERFEPGHGTPAR